MSKANVIMFTTVWYIGVPRNYLYACWKSVLKEDIRRYGLCASNVLWILMSMGDVASLVFLLFLSQVQVESYVRDEVEGCISALCLKCFILTSPTTLAGPNYICMTEELLNDYHLLYIKYSCVFIIRELARILTAILRKLPITTDRSKPIVIL